ncbi:MAG: type I secretion system permease/ATPase [Sphingomicrobium sp.]
MLSWVKDSAIMQSALALCRPHIRYAALFSALINLLIIGPMLYMLQVYDRVIPTQGHMTLLLLTLALTICLLSMAALEVIRSRLLVRASVQLDTVLAPQIMQAAMVQTDDGRRIARQATREFDVLRQALTGPAILGLLDSPWVPVYILIAFLVHPWIGMLCFVGVAIVLFLAWQSETTTRAPLQQANAAAGRAHSGFDSALAASDVVRALGMRNALVNRHRMARGEMMELQTSAGLTSSRLSANSKFIRLLLQSLAIGVGALLAIDAKISPGSVFASMFIVGRAMGPIDQLVGSWRTIVQARGAIKLLDQLVSGVPRDVSRTLLPPPSGRLELQQVAFLNEQRHPILANIGFKLESGEVVAIVGPSGAGKSTLVKLVAGALQPSHGTIRFDGADQRDWDPEQLASHVGYMPQENNLFAGTIKENITRFAPPGEGQAALDAEAVTAAKLAGAHEMILQLSGGYDHSLGFGGSGLSAGQGQRISLARALFRSPRYVILDEPNASLDAEGDAQLAVTLEGLKTKGMTILVVAHRLSVLPVVDKLMVIQNGKLAMFGPRDDVLRSLAPTQQRVTAGKSQLTSFPPPFASTQAP